MSEKPKLTENERAATFIGWHSGQHSHSHPDGTPAPDMTDPRNYMKALEAVVASKKFWSVSLDLSGPMECRFEKNAMSIKPPTQDIYRDGETVARAVIAALAALYDAEHP